MCAAVPAESRRHKMEATTSPRCCQTGGMFKKKAELPQYIRFCVNQFPKVIRTPPRSEHVAISFSQMWELGGS